MNAEKITRQSKSNLALAFVALGRERRRDITTFYAFCRLIDDIADDPELGVAEKQRLLDTWRNALRSEIAGESAIAPEIRVLLAKYRLTPAMFEEIISGVKMDLRVTRYASFEDLRVYCYRVASAVGLISIEIFGYRNPGCREYAIELGLALQMTNIIRDVDRDLQQNRVYLPLEDLARFGYTESELIARVYDDRFVALMEFQAARASDFYARASAALPVEDRRSMVAAEIMRSIYQALLQRIVRDHYRVFDKDYRLSRLEKMLHIVSRLVNFR